MAIRSEYVTRAREQIANVLQRERRFLSAAEIHHLLEAGGAKVALSTVYRNLEHLQSKGELTARTEGDGETRYMPCEPEHHHHHAICSTCGRVEDVDCSAIEQFTESLRESSGFALDGHAMEFFGKCRQCQ
ncbi:MAG: transcriptional repressor [Candidatus Eremiobacteraeota bacterium]|nr:transcriptional repressor [Candidatus Eremiobacteraeota bacterium]MBV8583051.1 transcriptional repressor [Candidatus Eremiobacteraeota bacterium]MBV8654403.1 transcriptional repressor [Candidatus Eremiobacteraeota bacterium]